MSSIVMKKNLGYAVIGLTVGLVCGFKAANYGYRSELNANRTSAVNSAASLNPNTVGNGQRGQAVIEAIVWVGILVGVVIMASLAIVTDASDDA